MPCYRLLCLARPETTPEYLAKMFKDVARLVYREKGVVREVSNLGIRPLAYRMKNRRQYFEDARWLQAVYDVSPAALGEVEKMLKQEEAVIKCVRPHITDVELCGGWRRARSAGAWCGGVW